MKDERGTQEVQADRRTAELVSESRDTRRRVIEALEAVQRELDRAKQEAHNLGRETRAQERRRWWLW